MNSRMLCARIERGEARIEKAEAALVAMTADRDHWKAVAEEALDSAAHVAAERDDLFLRLGKCVDIPSIEHWQDRAEKAETKLKIAAEALVFIAWGCLVPPDGGSPKHPKDCANAARAALKEIE